MFWPPPGNDLSSAARTCGTVVGCSNSTITAVPPANSMPSGMPLVMKTAAPARMTIHDSTSACTRQRRKSKRGCWKICMGLNGQRRDLLPPAERQFEQRLRHENRGEQVGDQTEEQRHGEAADRPGAELEQEGDRDQRRDVRVEQRPEDAIEAGVDRRAHAARRLE